MRTLVILAGLALFATPASAILHSGPPIRVCPMIYRPVCAITWDRHLKTFANRCLAEAEHAWIRHDGRCRRERR